MAGWRDWFVMTRHERRGAIALLVMLVLIVLAVWLMRSRTQALTPAEALQLQRFEARVDSLAQVADSVARNNKSSHVQSKKSNGGMARDVSRKGKKGKKKQPKAQLSPHRVDPVPRF